MNHSQQPEVDLPSLELACRQLFEKCELERLDEMRAHRRRLKVKSQAEGGEQSPEQQQQVTPLRRAPPEQQLPRLRQDQLQELKEVLKRTQLLSEHWCRPTGGLFFHLDRAMCHLALAEGWHERVHHIIGRMELRRIRVEFEDELEGLWDQATYRLHHQHKPERLNSVVRYRLRKRHPCPTLQRSGPKKYKVSEAAKRELVEQFSRNPKPSRGDCELIRQRHGLKLKTVRNWFKNHRQRVKQDEARGHSLGVHLVQHQTPLQVQVQVKAEPLTYCASETYLAASQESYAAPSDYYSQSQPLPQPHDPMCLYTPPAHLAPEAELGYQQPAAVAAAAAAAAQPMWSPQGAPHEFQQQVVQQQYEQQQQPEQVLYQHQPASNHQVSSDQTHESQSIVYHSYNQHQAYQEPAWSSAAAAVASQCQVQAEVEAAEAEAELNYDPSLLMDFNEAEQLMSEFTASGAAGDHFNQAGLCA